MTLCELADGDRFRQPTTGLVGTLLYKTVVGGRVALEPLTTSVTA